MNKAAKTYYKKLYKSFPMMTHLEKDFLKEFKKSLINHASLYPHASIDDYYKKYGQPCDIIATYYEHFESEYITKYMNSRKIIKRSLVILTTMITIVSIIIALVCYRVYVEIKANETYYEDYTLEVIE